jgi:hypothetical protein
MLLVAAGEKPTVEKIRQTLGTGSPNAVARMLNHWRERLGQRLQEVIKLPDAPSEVGQASAEVWRLSLGHAEALARTALTEEQNALFADQTSLIQERKLWEIALAEARAQAADSAAQCAQAHAQLQERQALVDQLEGQRVDLMQQRYRLTDQFEQQHTALETLRAEHSSAQMHKQMSCQANMGRYGRSAFMAESGHRLSGIGFKKGACKMAAGGYPKISDSRCG